MKKSQPIEISISPAEARTVKRLHKRDGLSEEAIIRLCAKFGLPLVEAEIFGTHGPSAALPHKLARLPADADLLFEAVECSDDDGGDGLLYRLPAKKGKNRAPFAVVKQRWNGEARVPASITPMSKAGAARWLLRTAAAPDLAECVIG